MAIIVAEIMIEETQLNCSVNFIIQGALRNNIHEMVQEYFVGIRGESVFWLWKFEISRIVRIIDA